MDAGNNSETNDMKFRIVYDGPALETHEMNVRDLAPALLSLSDALQEAGKTLYGNKTVVSVKVNASFKAGSFGIDLVASSTSWFKQAVDFLSGDSATAAANLIAFIGLCPGSKEKICKGLIQLIKWIGPRKIKKLHNLPDSNIEVFVDDESEIYDSNVIELYKNIKLRSSLQEVISKPLEQEGIDSFASTVDDGLTFMTINKQEAHYFKVNLPAESIISEYTVEKALQIKNISFNEGSRWRFSDGASSFLAEIKDQKFISDIDNNTLNFSKGDMLLVDLKVTQYMIGDAIKTIFEIEHVKKQLNPQRQIDLPFE